LRGNSRAFITRRPDVLPANIAICRGAAPAAGALSGILAQAGLDSFEALWVVPHIFVEPVNRRRGGWSGVSKLTLPDEKGRPGTWYLKRQEQQKRYSLRYPLGAPTFRYEVDALRLGLQLHWPAVQLQAYGVCNSQGRQRAVLLTRAIELPSLESFHYDAAPLLHQPCILSRVGEQLLAMHASGWQHGALFPCHMFVDPGTGEMQLIDFERARKRTTAGDAACADLTQLLRRADWLSPVLLGALLRPYCERAPRVIAQLSRRFPTLVPALKESRT